MKSTHVKNETEEIEFPCLMKSKLSNLVLLAKRICKVNGLNGTVILSNDSNSPIGLHSITWSVNAFEPLPKGEQIILEN